MTKFRYKRSPKAVPPVQPKPSQPMSSHDIKRHILLTSGPVATYRTFAKQGSPHLRTITKQQYSSAVHELQATNLGNVLIIKKGSRPESIVFIKKPPKDAKPGLERQNDLCSLEKYTEKYQRPVPSGMNSNVRLKVVEMGYVSEEQMKSQLNIRKFEFN